MRFKAISWLLVMGIFSAATALAGNTTTPKPPPLPAKTIHLTLVHINDVHGQLESRMVGGKSYGGYARLATLMDEIRKEGKAERVMLIHAGDEFSKGDELTRRSKGAANIAIMNKVGVDLWTPGNGEFYDGIVNLQKRMGEAKFKTVCANVVLKADGTSIAPPFVIERVGDVKIAFVGLGFIHENHPSARPLKLENAIQVANQLVPQLRKQSDVVVAVTHMGLPADELLARMVPGIDVIIGGHSHTVLPEGKTVRGFKEGATLICQAGSMLDYAGRLDLTLNRKADGSWEIVQAKDQLIRLDEKIKLDPAVTALIAKLSEHYVPAKVKAMAK